LSREEPHAGGGIGNELLDGNAKGTEPEESEQDVPQNVVEVSWSLDRSDEGSLLILWGTNAVKENTG